MPELPEVESARLLIEQTALGRRIEDVNDSDTYVCRPHKPGEIRDALLGRRLTSAHRRGKSMWCETSGVGRSRRPGPTLGIHLGMSGKLVFTDGHGGERDGGDYWRRPRAVGDHRFSRFWLRFTGGAMLMLLDPRRLSRVRLDPPVDALGPDAAEVTLEEFRALMTRGTAPVKARLMDQESLAGVGNLLADQTLWLAKINPARSVSDLSRAQVDRLYHALREAVGTATAAGGVQVLSILGFRSRGSVCPRCGAPMRSGKVGGRATWWCSREQA